MLKSNKIYLAKCVSRQEPQSVQAKKLVGTIRKYTRVVYIDDKKFGGFLLPLGLVLSAGIIGEAQIKVNGKFYKMKLIKEAGLFNVYQAPAIEQVEFPPFCEPEEYQHLFVYKRNLLHIFDRLPYKELEREIFQVRWLGTPIFNRFGHLSGLCLGITKKKIAFVFPHEIIKL